MFYGSREHSGSADIGRTGVTVYAAGAGGGGGVPPAHASELQRKVDAVAQATQTAEPVCPRCGQTMGRKDTRPVSWLARFGRPSAPVSRFVCRTCHVQCRPLLDLLGMEPGRIGGSLA